ncbi:MAG: class I SAM-dependent methyltransferase [Pyrinomonadaceae bacterium]|nr:class I SAM-dependent methyltransferase [Pyrinomonadaceae bacterium]
MNYERIYNYRFKDVDPVKKNLVWNEVASFIYNATGKPQTVLDPAGGMCEFINNIKSPNRFVIDLNREFLDKYADESITKIIGDNLKVEIPENHFELVFISNFLEHLYSQDQVAEFLGRMFRAVKTGGYIAVMGPNYRFAYKEYFDFADHTVCLTELGVTEHLYGAGFEILKVHPRFLPMSFRGGLPVNKFLVQTYLQMPFAWRFFGKQFLVIGRKQ